MHSTDRDTLTVLDHGEPITYGYDDLVKYHGYGYLGGVALAFRAMQGAWPLLAGGLPPERKDITLDTAFPGPGGRDGFEMVTRMVSGERYKVDFSIAPPEVPTSPSGSYFFRFGYRGRAVDLALRPGIVSEEFLRLARQESRSVDEAARLEVLKRDMADRLLARPAAELFDITVLPAA